MAVGVNINIDLLPNQPLGTWTTRVDYSSIGTPTPVTQPIYVGYAAAGASDTDVNSTAWTVLHFTYDATGLLLQAQKVALAAAWASRTTLTYT